MTKPSPRIRYSLAFLGVLAGCGASADPGVRTTETTQALSPIVTNGSFETGDYTGWTLEENSGQSTFGIWGIATNGQTINPGDSVFDFRDLVTTSSGSPGLPITYAATDGTQIAFQLQNGPENHRMFQTITLPACQPLLLWDMAYTNHSGGFDSFSQFSAVNIRDAADDSILATPFKTNPGDLVALPGMTPFLVDLTAFSAQTVRLDFEHQVQNFFFDAAWDNIRVICKGISASPGTLAFGAVDVGTTSAPQTTTVTNFAATPLTITAAPVTGAFSMTSGPTLPITLATGETTSFTVVFQPIAPGAVSGTLSLDSDDPNGATVVALTGSGNAAAALTPSPSSVAFGTVQVGQSSGPQVVTLTNTGTTALTITSASAPLPFSVNAPSLPITLLAGASTTIDVAFDPTAPGPASDVLSLVSNDATSPTLVPLSGTGVDAALSIAPSPLAFGNQRVGIPSAPQNLRATNTGIGPVTITATAISGPFSRSGPALPVTLAAGAFADFAVSFSPNTPGPAAGQLSITSTAASSPDVVALSGTGTAPQIVVGPGSLDFGDQRVGTTGTRTVAVSNPGNDILKISAASTVGVFANTDTFPISLPPGGTATLTVRFTPTSATTFNGNLTITSDAVPTTKVVPLTGRGVEPVVAVNPGSLGFGNRRVGTTSPAQSLTISNIGTSPLLVSSISVPAPFVLNAAPTPFVVPPGASSVIQVAFAPAVAGSVNRVVTIISDAATSPTVIGVSGTGVEPLVSASTTSLDFGNVRKGTVSAGKAITLTNTGTSPLALSAATAPAQYTITSAPLPLSVLPGASATFTVKFAPSVLGLAAGNVAITSDAAASPTLVAVTGVSVQPQLLVNPSSHDFGDILVGTASAAKTFIIQNPGTDTLTVTAVSVAAPFALTAPLSLPAQIAPNGSIAFAVVFSPTSRATAAATISIASDAGPANVSLTGRGVAPLIEASLDPVDFGTVPIGSTQSLSLQLTNSGDAALTLTTLAFGGADSGDFAFTTSPALPAVVAPGAALTLSIDFTPNDHGARNATLTATSDALGTPTLVVGLQGSGSGARIVLSPTALDFGPANVAVTTAPEIVTVSNTGETDLVVSSIVLGGANAGDFAVAASLPLTVAAGASAELSVTFTPTAVGGRSATATIVTTDPLVPTSAVALSGIGESPVIAVVPATLAFGNIRSGQELSLPLTLSNTGSGPLTITTLDLSGADAAQFSVEVISLPLVLAPGASRAVAVKYSPTVLGSAQAKISVLSDDLVATTVEVPLTGTGVSPTVAITPSDLDFGGQLVGRPSAPRQVHIQNTGTGPLSVLSLGFAGAQAASFSLASPPVLPASIVPGGELVISVQVTPPVIGAQAADFVIVTDSPDAPNASVGMTALGISTAFSVTPSSIDFATTHVGSPTTPVAVTLTNLSGDTLTLVDAVLGGASPGDFTVSSIAGTVAPNASVTAMVTYAPAAAATSAATITFRTTDSAVAQAVVTVSGKAVSSFLTVDHMELAFGEIEVGDSSGPKAITVTNATTTPVTIASVVSEDAQFEIAIGGATAPIPPGASVSFTVTFAPTTAASAASRVLVTLQGATTPEVTITVTGEGTKGGGGGGCSTTHGSPGLVMFGALVLLRALRRRR